MIVWINLPYACGGIIIQDDIVIYTPPIFHWMKDKYWEECKKWLKSKDAEIKELTCKN